MSASAAQEARAAGLLARARRHKRLSAHHRREAARSMAALAQYRAELAARGVRLVIAGEAPEEERHGHTHDPHQGAREAARPQAAGVGSA